LSLVTWLDRRPVLQCVSMSIILNLVVEILSRRSVITGVGFLCSEPLLFIFNTAIIMLTLLVSLACKRRYFVQIAVSVIWLGLGVTNCVLLGFRTTPLAAIDFQLFLSVASIVFKYLKPVQLILIVLAALCVVAGLVLAWFKTPKRKPKYLTAVCAVCLVAMFVVCSTILFEKMQVVSDFGNLADAYKDYGFVYCFSRSLLDHGIKRPETYSEADILGVLRAIHADENKEPELTPNIIMVQLESFFDVNYLEGLSFSENPIPVFKALKENCPHGFLTVPSIGAGTANTEFEILTGMNLGYFGAGEYPYKTVLQDQTCESICYNLAELGYINHAIHNHEGTFYQRHEVFSNLGFNTFTSLEYMNDVKYNPFGWAKDEILTDQIVRALNSTQGQDFIYTISVQAHGKYPQEVVDDTQQIKVAGIEAEKKRVAFEYFINQLHETDAFIRDLISQLLAYKEPVILVLFGDHLPSFDIENDDLINGNRFMTEYVIWSNFDMAIANQDLNAYQLSAYVLKQCDISNGILTKIHQTLHAQDNYQAALELLEYDMVCGEQIAYGGENPHLPTELQMGVTEINISCVRKGPENAFIFGEGFTKWSKVLVNGRMVETLFIDSNTLIVAAEEIDTGDSLVVAQTCDKSILSETCKFECP